MKNFALQSAALAALLAAALQAQAADDSKGVYRIPYADGTEVSVFDDHVSHRPALALDLVGEPRDRRHRIVAAADGVVMAIQDDYSAQQSGRAASECRNNFVWLSHANGEWTLYSHMRAGTTTADAGLRVGDAVRAGQYLGEEGAVGCAMLSHLHFEVAVPRAEQPIDANGFLSDNADRSRLRVPRFCTVKGARVTKDARYVAAACKE